MSFSCQRSALVALILPFVSAAGTLPIGSTVSTGDFITFSNPDITFGTCIGALSQCFLNGQGSAGAIGLGWSLVSSTTPIQTIGTGPVFGINQGGGAITLRVSDVIGGHPGPDSLAGNIGLTSGTQSISGPALTDITGTLTFTTVDVTTPALVAAILSFYGSIPAVGSTATLNLIASCGASTPCLNVLDPQGLVTSASLTSNAPEPATFALISVGLVGLTILRRRRN